MKTKVKTYNLLVTKDQLRMLRFSLKVFQDLRTQMVAVTDHDRDRPIGETVGWQLIDVSTQVDEILKREEGHD